MGLDARVRCRCFEDGLTTPPPFARELIVVDEDSWLELSIPFNGNEEIYQQFDEWQDDCCEHAGMDYALVGIANWTGYRAFLDVLKRAGWEHFPTLHSELPENNGGHTDPAAAAEILAELEYFRRLPELGKATYLVETVTGDVLWKRHGESNRTFVWCGSAGLKMGLDSDGFFIVPIEGDVQPGPEAYSDGGSPRKLFRSMRFEQRLLDPELADEPRDRRVEYKDIRTGYRFACTCGLTKEVPCPDGRMEDDEGRVCQDFPRLVHVEERPVRPADFEYILGSLEEVCRASVETGNPIAWC